MLLQRLERDHGEGLLVRCRQDHGRRNTRLECFAPGAGAHAPTITGNSTANGRIGSGVSYTDKVVLSLGKGYSAFFIIIINPASGPGQSPPNYDWINGITAL